MAPNHCKRRGVGPGLGFARLPRAGLAGCNRQQGYRPRIGVAGNPGQADPLFAPGLGGVASAR